jgi:hypothetical protein
MVDGHLAEKLKKKNTTVTDKGYARLPELRLRTISNYV